MIHSSGSQEPTFVDVKIGIDGQAVDVSKAIIVSLRSAQHLHVTCICRHCL